MSRWSLLDRRQFLRTTAVASVGGRIGADSTEPRTAVEQFYVSLFEEDYDEAVEFLPYEHDTEANREAYLRGIADTEPREREPGQDITVEAVTVRSLFGVPLATVGLPLPTRTYLLAAVRYSEVVPVRTALASYTHLGLARDSLSIQAPPTIAVSTQANLAGPPITPNVRERWEEVTLSSSFARSPAEVWPDTDAQEPAVFTVSGQFDVTGLDPGTYVLFPWGCDTSTAAPTDCQWLRPRVFVRPDPAEPDGRGIEWDSIDILGLQVDVQTNVGPATGYTLVYRLDGSRWYVGGLLPASLEPQITERETTTRAPVAELDSALTAYRTAVSDFVETFAETKAEGYATLYYVSEPQPPSAIPVDNRSEGFKRSIVNPFFRLQSDERDEDVLPSDLGANTGLDSLLSPALVPEQDAENIYRFTEEMFLDSPDRRAELQPHFKRYFLGTGAEQEHLLTIHGKTLAELRDEFEQSFDENRRAFVEQCRGTVDSSVVRDIIAVVEDRTDAIRRMTATHERQYTDLVERADDDQTIKANYREFSTEAGGPAGAFAGSIIGGTVGGVVGAAAGGPGGAAYGASIGSQGGLLLGYHAGRLVANLGSAEAMEARTGSKEFVGSDAWKAVTAHELVQYYLLTQEPRRVLPGALVDQANDSALETPMEALFAAGCQAAADRLAETIRIESLDTTTVTPEDRIGETSLASQKGTIQVSNPNAESITPYIVLSDCSIAAESSTGERKHPRLLFPDPEELPEIAPGDSAEIQFGYLVPLDAPSNFSVQLTLQANPIAVQSATETATIEGSLGSASDIWSDILGGGTLYEGQQVDETARFAADTSRAIVTLSYPGSDLDLHVYDADGNHVGVNDETGEFETEIDGALASGPDGGVATRETVRLDDPEGTYTAAVDARDTGEQGSAYSLVTSEMPVLPAKLGVRPNRIERQILPGERISPSVAVEERTGFRPLEDVSLSVSEVTHEEGTDALDASRVEIEQTAVTVQAGNTAHIDLAVDAPLTLAEGTYTGTLTVDAGTQTATVPIELDRPRVGREVPVRIRPGGEETHPNPAKTDSVSVVIRGTAEFDPSASVDVDSLRFAVPELLRLGGGAAVDDGRVEDADGDGHDDLIVRFPTSQTGLSSERSTGILVGKTTDERRIIGVNSVRSQTGDGTADGPEHGSDSDGIPNWYVVAGVGGAGAGYAYYRHRRNTTETER